METSCASGSSFLRENSFHYEIAFIKNWSGVSVFLDAFIDKQEGFLSHTNYVAGISHSVLGYGQNLSDADYFGVHLFSLDVGFHRITGILPGFDQDFGRI